MGLLAGSCFPNPRALRIAERSGQRLLRSIQGGLTEEAAPRRRPADDVRPSAGASTPATTRSPATWRSCGPISAPRRRARRSAIPGEGLTLIWILGSSGTSRQVAGRRARAAPRFARTLALRPPARGPCLYRENFRLSDELSAPWQLVVVNVFAAETDEDATALHLPPAGVRQFGQACARLLSAGRQHGWLLDPCRAAHVER